MAVVRWDPIRELAAMQERLNQLLQEPGRRVDDDETMTRGDWTFPVDIYQDDQQALVLLAELPGVRREAIDLHVENGTLTISGERQPPEGVAEDRFLRRERASGTFSRSFSIPAALDIEKVRADYRDGVLTVMFPMRDDARPKQVRVPIA